MAENHVGLAGIEFVEFSSPAPENLRALFQGFGFTEKSKHHEKAMSLFQQGSINLILNHEKGSFAESFHHEHGPCISAMGWRVKDAEEALKVAVERGATAAREVDHLRNGVAIPAIVGIGKSLIYFIDDFNSDKLYSSLGFSTRLPKAPQIKPLGFEVIDHLTNNVPKGTMEYWSDYYKNIFGFEEVRYFDIKGAKTGLTSYALRSPCGFFCIPINEGTEEKSQINEYLREYNGPGVQHLAFTTSDIVQTVSALQGGDIETLDIDEDYYQTVFDRVPNVSENHKKLEELNILVDGDDDGYLLQIFTKNVVGPIFIEIIQRKNHLSFGEGNFGALFRSIEKDQEKRGVL